jgi:HAD superfamily hydrolase (TIGR01509 family)
MGSVKAVIFDLDATLVDSHGSHLEAFKSVFARRGVSVEDEDIAPKFGMTAVEIMNEFLREKGISKFSTEEIVKIAEERAVEYRKCDLKLMPGAMELIKSLHGKEVRMAIATCSSRKNLEFAVKKTGIGGYIEVFVSGDGVKNGKPDPEILLKAAEKLGLKADECLAIDDSLLGVKAAVSAGMKCIAVATGEWPPETLKKETDMVFKDLTEVLPRIDEILNPGQPGMTD